MELLLLLALVFPLTQETNFSSLQKASPSYIPQVMFATVSFQSTIAPKFHMEVLPGGGFDNLRNLDMGLVHAYNYSLFVEFLLMENTSSQIMSS